MQALYVESTPQWRLTDTLDDIIMNADLISDRETKIKYIKIGAGFDIETSKIRVNSKKIPSVAYCYHWQFGFRDFCIMGRSLNTMKDFMLLLVDRIKDLKPQTKLLVFDANLGYEWQFCKHYWKEIGITKLFAKEERNPLLVEISDTVVFREVIGLFGGSLAQIAKNYCNMRKLVGDLDYSKIRVSSTEMTKEEIGYCVRDVEILVKLAESHVYENYLGKNPRLPYTQTGIVRDAIKRALGKHLKQERDKIASWMPTEQEYELFRTKLFKGGISGGNILLLNKKLKNVRGADITSDYPYQMLLKKFPMGGVSRCDSDRFMTDDKPYIAVIRFHKFKSRNAHALMSAHKALNKDELKNSDQTILDNNRIQYAEFVELTLNDIEFKSLKQAYRWEHYTIKKCWVFEEGYAHLPKHIRDTCKEWYSKKQRLKEEKKKKEDAGGKFDNEQELRDAKAFVNSIFGMMCTALYMEEYVFEEESCSISPDLSKKTYEECCKYLFLSPYWGFWITSHARAMLIDVISKFPKVIVQYDTDSVYFIDDGSEQAEGLKNYLNKRNKVMITMNHFTFGNDSLMETLGTWDFTEKFKCFKGLGSKRYMYEKQDGDIKVVIAGCRKDKDTKRSTLLEQCDYNNKNNSTKIDYFDFFTDGMHIDQEHANKLGSKYIDTPIRVNSKNEVLEIPSCLVLKPIDFTMGMANFHKTLMIAAQRLIENTKVNRRVYDAWRQLKSNTSTTTQLLELTMIGN